jgi:hypothetical protein
MAGASVGVIGSAMAHSTIERDSPQNVIPAEGAPDKSGTLGRDDTE